MNLIKSFHLADPIWEIWDINTHHDFNNKFMVLGKFHSKVPGELVKEYEIVERLLCYSYYSYDLFQEAFSKATRIIEMAVKYKMTELAIEFKEKEKFNNLLIKLKQNIPNSLFLELDLAREVRNVFAHLKSGQQFGITVHRSFLQIVNILNILFLDNEAIVKNEGNLLNLKSETSHFQDGLFLLEVNNVSYLIWSLIPYSCSYDLKNFKTLWGFHPVLSIFPQTTEDLFFTPPICLVVKEVKFDGNELTGITDENKPIKARLTSKKKFKDLLLKHKEIINTSDSIVKSLFVNYLDTELAYEIVKFKYNHCWD